MVIEVWYFIMYLFFHLLAKINYNFLNFFIFFFLLFLNQNTISILKKLILIIYILINNTIQLNIIPNNNIKYD